MVTADCLSSYRSYIALQENCPLKRLYFTNIYDVEFTKELIEEDLKKPIQSNLPRKFINNNNEPFNYNDTVIKKVSGDEKKPLSVIDFLNSIKEENENDFQDDYVSIIFIYRMSRQAVCQPDSKWTTAYRDLLH